MLLLGFLAGTVLLAAFWGVLWSSQEDIVDSQQPARPPSSAVDSGPAKPKQADSAASEQPWTVQRILAWTTEHLQKHGSESPRLESEILLAHARKCQRIHLYAHFNDVVNEETRAEMRQLVKRRVNREPVAYLVGHREFFSLDFFVEPGVFIPRPETETLVIKTLEKLTGVSAPQALELCTGSGCIPVTLAVRRPDLRVMTVEKNDVPFRVAQKNAERHQVQQRVQFFQGDLFSALPAGSGPFDVIVSNPPYVCQREIAELDADVREHEPHAALDGGQDGLDFVRRILADAPAYLKSGGWCLLEMDPSQIRETLRLASELKVWQPGEVYVDLFGAERCVGLQRR